MKKYKKDDVLEIKWTDTFGYNGWEDDEGIDKRTNKEDCLFVGYLIKETKAYFIICMGLDKNKDFFSYNKPCWIPKGFVNSIRKLK